MGVVRLRLADIWLVWGVQVKLAYVNWVGWRRLAKKGGKRLVCVE